MPKVTKGKKQWYNIAAPEMFRGKSLGEVTLLEPKSFIGKVFSVNLMNIINDVRKQNTNVFFEASEIREGRINTNVIGYEMMASSLKRLIRRGRNKLDLSFVCLTSDGIHVRIKPIVITFANANSCVRRALGKKIVEEVSRRVKKTTFENLISNTLNRRMQQGWYDACKKIYPIKIFDIRAIKIEKSKRGLKQVIEVPEEKEVSETQSVPDKPGEKKEVKKEVKEAEKPEEKAESKKEETKAEIKKPSKDIENGLEKTESSQKEAPKEEPKTEVPKEAPKVEPKTEVKAAVEG